MEIWDITGQRAITTQTVSAYIGGNGQVLSPYIVPSDNADKFAMFSPDGSVTIWDIASGQKLVTFQGKVSSSPPVAISPTIKWYDHDQYLLAFTRGGALEAWNAATGERLFNLYNTARAYSPPTVSPDGDYLARFSGPQQPAEAALRVDTLEILNAHSGSILHDYHLNMPQGAGVNINWLPDSSRLLMTDMLSNSKNSSTNVPTGNTIQVSIWNIFTGQTTFAITASHAETVWTTPDGQYLVIDSPDGRSMKIWQLSSSHLVATVETPGIAIDPYAIFSVSNHYLVVGEKSSFDLWDMPTGKLLFKYHGFTPLTVDGDGGSNVFWSPDEKYLTIIAWKSASPGAGILALWRMP
jgi:WD40 repeat protein